MALVSIIIPVFNQLSYTQQCLESLWLTTNHHDVEVVVFDNGSTDGTSEYLQSIQAMRPQLVVERSDKNLGYSLANNRAADRARGSHYVLLNNDTITTPGWLAALLKPLESPGVGIVGAKLLYPGREIINHAGYVFGDSVNAFYLLYEGCPSDFPPANREREFQAVLGACVALRRTDFHAVGGLSNFGLEDIDLCLKLRAHGLSTRYAPSALVYHYGQMTIRNSPAGSIPTNSSSEFQERWPRSKLIADDHRYYQEDHVQGLRTGSGRIVAVSPDANFQQVMRVILQPQIAAQSLGVDAIQQLVQGCFGNPLLLVEVLELLVVKGYPEIAALLCTQWHMYSSTLIEPLLYGSKLLAKLGQLTQAKVLAARGLDLTYLAAEQRQQFESILAVPS